MWELETQQGEVEIGRCHICAQTFETQEDLRKHRSKAHGGREPVTGWKGAGPEGKVPDE